MKRKPKALILTYCFPPYPSPESFITTKFLCGISKEFDIDVITFEYLKKKEFELDINHYYKSKLNVIRVPVPNIFQKILNLPRLPIRPDRFLLLNHIMKKKLKSIDLSKYDLFFTRSQFHSCHLLGLFLKKQKPRTPWISSYSDPWHDNPVQKKISILESLSKKYQDEVLRKSNLLIFPIPELRDFYQNLVNFNLKDKSIITPHTYDSKLYSVKIAKNKVFTIRFFGKIYANRNLLPFLESIKQLTKSGYKINVELYLDDEYLESHSKYLKMFKSFAKFKRYVNVLKCLELMKKTTLLLLIDVDQNYGKIFFQSKLVDYIGSKNMILHLGKSNTFNKRLILENNGFSCQNNIKSITNTLKKIIKIQPKFKPNKKTLDKYKIENVSKKFCKDIKRFLKNA